MLVYLAVYESGFFIKPGVLTLQDKDSWYLSQRTIHLAMLNCAQNEVFSYSSLYFICLWSTWYLSNNQYVYLNRPRHTQSLLITFFFGLILNGYLNAKWNNLTPNLRPTNGEGQGGCGSMCTLISHSEDSHSLWTTTCVTWAVRSMDKEVGESVKLIITL